jgi:putative flavoprotein involved in K+ transport
MTATPAVRVALRWPDGNEQRFAWPGDAVGGRLVTGARYPLPELLRRTVNVPAADRRAITARVTALGGRGLAEVTELRAGLPRPRRRDRAAHVGGHHRVVVVGAGQSGLAVSWLLRREGIEHLVLERDSVASRWRHERWDSFCLVTPNWQCELPGHPLTGLDPDGFATRDEVVAYVDAYAAGAPVVEGVEVTQLKLGDDGGFRLETSEGAATADQVVLAVGGHQAPAVPPLAGRVASTITQLHSAAYRDPGSLPDGGVLVVGSAQSGVQLVEDLHRAGRDVHCAVGTAPRVARAYRGRDVIAWQHDMGLYDLPIDQHPDAERARAAASYYVAGRDGGHDLDLRELARAGVVLHGRLTAAAGTTLRFAGDLRANLDAADDAYNLINREIDEWIARHDVTDVPPPSTYTRPWAPAGDGGGALDLAAAGISTIVWATGFRADWSWVRLPAFDGAGPPAHARGVTPVPGLYVIGLPWLHTWGSSRFAGIARDAEHLAGHVARHALTATAPGTDAACPSR